MLSCGEEFNHYRWFSEKVVSNKAIEISIRLLLEKLGSGIRNKYSLNIHCGVCVQRLTQWMKNMKNFYLLKSYQMHRIAITVAAAIFMAGCASVPAPTEQMAASRAEVNNASSAGGNEFAPLQMKSAMEKMAGAEQAMADKKYDQARQLAEQAQVDAQLAEAMARSAKAQKAADAVQEASRVLREELDRKSK